MTRPEVVRLVKLADRLPHGGKQKEVPTQEKEA